jgi:toxin ParE1/3/4
VTLRLCYTQKEVTDLDNIYDFIASGNPLRAETYIEDIKKACRSLCETSLIGVNRADLGPDVRILPLWRRIVIAYQVLPDCVRLAGIVGRAGLRCDHGQRPVNKRKIRFAPAAAIAPADRILMHVFLMNSPNRHCFAML